MLRDEAEEYAAKLAAAGVPVKQKRYKGHYHNSMVELPVMGSKAEEAIREFGEFIHSTLADHGKVS